MATVLASVPVLGCSLPRARLTRRSQPVVQAGRAIRQHHMLHHTRSEAAWLAFTVPQVGAGVGMRWPGWGRVQAAQPRPVSARPTPQPIAATPAGAAAQPVCSALPALSPPPAGGCTVWHAARRPRGRAHDAHGQSRAGRRPPGRRRRQYQQQRGRPLIAADPSWCAPMHPPRTFICTDPPSLLHMPCPDLPCPAPACHCPAPLLPLRSCPCHCLLALPALDSHFIRPLANHTQLVIHRKAACVAARLGGAAATVGTAPPTTPPCCSRPRAALSILLGRAAGGRFGAAGQVVPAARSRPVPAAPADARTLVSSTRAPRTVTGCSCRRQCTAPAPHPSRLPAPPGYQPRAHPLIPASSFCRSRPQSLDDSCSSRSSSGSESNSGWAGALVEPAPAPAEALGAPPLAAAAVGATPGVVGAAASGASPSGPLSRTALQGRGGEAGGVRSAVALSQRRECRGAHFAEIRLTTDQQRAPPPSSLVPPWQGQLEPAAHVPAHFPISQLSRSAPPALPQPPPAHLRQLALRVARAEVGRGGLLQQRLLVIRVVQPAGREVAGATDSRVRGCDVPGGGREGSRGWPAARPSQAAAGRAGTAGAPGLAPLARPPLQLRRLADIVCGGPEGCRWRTGRGAARAQQQVQGG